MTDTAGLRALFEQLLHDFDVATTCETTAQDIETLPQCMADYRARFEALLADDGWHRYPDEKPPKEGTYVVYYAMGGYRELRHWDDALLWFSEGHKDPAYWRLLADPPREKQP